MRLRLTALLPRSLVGRVFALYSVTLLCFVAAGLGLFYRYQFSVEMEDAQLRAETLSSVILPIISDSAVIGDYDTIKRTLERAVDNSSFANASFIDLRGGVVRVPHATPPEVQPPQWLLNSVAAHLYDSNRPISVGGSDYGVLRLSFASDRIAGSLWQQTRIALALSSTALLGGLLLIRFPLVRWLGKLGQIQEFEQALNSGEAMPALMSAADEVPLEFRETFEVLGRAAASLQLQRAQAAVTLKAIADSVFTLDAEGRIVLANPAAQQMIGLPLSLLAGRAMQDVLPQAFDDATELDAWSGRRIRMANALGDERVVDSNLSRISDASGQTVGQVLACRDITDQHRLEQRLRDELASRERALVSLREVLEGLTLTSGTDAAASLGPSDDRGAISHMIGTLVAQLQARGAQLSAIFALTPDAFLSFDAQRRVNYVSPAFAQLTGIAHDVTGMDEAALEELLRRHADGASTWRGFAAMHGATPDEGRQVILEIQRPTQRMLELRLREGSAAAISQVLALRDVSHEFEVDRMKSEFLSMAAHELRTPMASIYGFVELLQHRAMDDVRRREVLDIIHRQSTLMIAIVNELLDLARIEARRGHDFVLEVLDLGTLVPALARDFSPPAEREPPELACPPAPCLVRADRNKLQQALGNVLSNAYKYSPAGGGVSLRLLQAMHNGLPMAGIEVSDSGIGMSAEQLARVSERFYRADASGAIPGTGLGMSIVKEIVELLGGHLALRSAAGAGTTVTLWLPLVNNEVPSTETRNSPP